MKHRIEDPPRIAERCLERLLPRDESREILADLRELFDHRRQTRGARHARRWYWRQVLSFSFRLRGRGRSRRSAPRKLGIGLTRDVGYAVRALLRDPGFAGTALLTLALGIGASSAIGSVVHHVVLRPLGHPDESRIVQIWPKHRFTRERYETYRDRSRSFEHLSAFVHVSFTLTGERTPEVLRGALVTSELFSVFGRDPVFGRDLESGDALAGSERVAIVSYETWQTVLGSDPDVLGSTIELGGFEGGRHTVVGVAPPGFRPFGRPCDVWAALAIDPDDDSYTHIANLGIVARLKPGVDSETARTELLALTNALVPRPPYLDKVPTYEVAPLRSVLVEDVEPTLLTLLAAVGVVLVLCCFNVANLLLARGAGRERELSVRFALGASRLRITRQLATESVVLAFFGGALGLGLAWLGSSFLVRLVPPYVPRADAITVDFPVALYALGISVAASLLFGLPPVLRLGRSALRARASGATRERSRLNQALVAAELALSLVLVVASGLLGKSLIRLSRVETGFRPDRVVSMRLLPSTVRYSEELLRHYYDEVLSALRTVPGVESAGAIQLLPMTSQFMAVGYSPDGTAVEPGVDPPSASYRIVTPDYRRTLEVPLVRGRDLDETDRPGGESVGLVNERFARELFPDGDPIGKQVHFDDGSVWFTVVGVVGDVRQHQLDLAPDREAYVPYAQDSWPSSMSLVVRTAGEPEALVPALREAIRSVDPDVPIREIRTMETVVADSMVADRTRTLVFSSFAALAFVLSAIGVYGVVGYSVSQRSRDLAVRMALGATRGRVLSETLAHGVRPVILGILLGSAIALLSSRALASFLFEVETTDPLVYLAVGAALLGTAIAAAYVPARRACGLDPMTKLKVDV
jgi:putative ABC transport system permease protein